MNYPQALRGVMGHCRVSDMTLGRIYSVVVASECCSGVVTRLFAVVASEPCKGETDLLDALYTRDACRSFQDAVVAAPRIAASSAAW